MIVQFVSRICSVSKFPPCTMKFGGKLFKDCAKPVDLDQTSEKLRANYMVFILYAQLEKTLVMDCGRIRFQVMEDRLCFGTSNYSSLP